MCVDEVGGSILGRRAVHVGSRLSSGFDACVTESWGFGWGWAENQL